jgi:hypothetical protein
MQLGMLHILTYTLKLTVMTGFDQNYDKRDVSDKLCERCNDFPGGYKYSVD